MTTSWEDLARQCRALADLADQCAGVPPTDLAPVDGDKDRRDVLAELDDRALLIRSLVAACRRATWQSLHDAGEDWAQIGRRWGTSRQDVWQTVKAPKRRR